MLVPVAGGAAAGRAVTTAAVAGGVSAAKEVSSESVGGAAQRTADTISETLEKDFGKRNWLLPK
jgi:hypothetical protein